MTHPLSPSARLFALAIVGVSLLVGTYGFVTPGHSVAATTTKAKVSTTTVKKTVKKPVATPVVAHSFEVSGWLPYWRAATSTADVLPNLNKLTEINPFGYTVKNDGTLYDAANLDSATSTWNPLISAARTQKVRVIPTVMWSNTQAISSMLSTHESRAVNIASIVSEVNKNNFDGIDIDYEGKLSSDKDNFSAYLKELSTAMGKKWVMCTIEARTPPQDLNTNAPLSDIQYSNDFKAINTYCDRVRFMTYDQESADKTLNQAAGSSIYTPVADPAWVSKAIQLAEKDIAPSKIEMGIATYGYEYDVTPYANGSGYMYDLLWSFNPKYALQIAAPLGIMPQRNASGELAFTYPEPTGAPAALPAGTSPATSTDPSKLTATAVTSIAEAANSYTLPGTMRYMTWSDSGAIAQKVALAKRLGIRGVAIFKLDGGEDQAMWNVLPVQR
jgi:spore germination protein YaaH